MPAATAERRAAVRALLREEEIHSQAELYARLARRGFEASQPVLSRDLRALGVAKTSGVYRVLEPERVTPLEALKSMLRSTETATHFVLVRCEPGAASAVARALEAEELSGIAGTIAGDDTVLVALASAAAGRKVRRRVAELL